MKARSTILKEVGELRKLIDHPTTERDERRLAYIVECTLYWVLNDGHRRPLKDVNKQIEYLRKGM